MGDFFNEVVIFLEENYVYVIGVGLIIILMLVGFLASRKKAVKENHQGEAMVNINDVNTGSISDVANTLQSNVMQPVDVVTFPEDIAPVIEQPDPFETIPAEDIEVLGEELVVAPMETEVPSFTSMDTAPTMSNNENVVTPIEAETPSFIVENTTSTTNNEAPVEAPSFTSMDTAPTMSNNENIVTPIEAEVPSFIAANTTPTINSEAPGTAPFVSEAPSFITSAPTPATNIEEPVVAPIIEEIKPTEEDKFEKTEVIDFSSLNSVEPMVDIAPIAAPSEIQSNDFKPFVVDQSQSAEPVDILNGESIEIDEANIQ